MTITVAQIRALLGVDEATLSDDSIEVVIDLETNVYRAAAVCAKILAAQYADKINIKAGPVSVEEEAKFAHWKSIAAGFDSRASSGGCNIDCVATGISESEIDSQREDTDRVQETFYRGMNSDDSTDVDWIE